MFLRVASAEPRAGITAPGCGGFAVGWTSRSGAWVCAAAAAIPSGWSRGRPVDCWRVEEYEPGRKLRLIAEMKLPGRAWLEFEVTPDGSGSLVRQTAFFDPIGIAGLLYWYAIYPLHQLVFSGMLRGIAGAAERAGWGS